MLQGFGKEIDNLVFGPAVHHQCKRLYRKMFDQKYRPEGHNPTFGIILCADTDEDIARYSEQNQNDHMFQAKHMLYMPSKEQLKQEIEREKEIYRLQCENPHKLNNG